MAAGSTTVRIVRHLRLPGVAAVAQLVGHQAQHLLGRADDDRQHQAGERQRPPKPFSPNTNV
jgi:hypothetical protein